MERIGKPGGDNKMWVRTGKTGRDGKEKEP